MTNAAAGVHELFMQRMQIVQEIARLNARQLYDRQVFGGCELDVMRCERDTAQAGVAASADEALTAARQRLNEALAALLACDEALAVWHERLADLDRKIAEA
jgi:hypothetical protein